MAEVLGKTFAVLFLTSPIWGLLIGLAYHFWSHQTGNAYRRGKSYGCECRGCLIEKGRPMFPDPEQAKREIDRMFDDMEQIVRRYEKW